MLKLMLPILIVVVLLLIIRRWLLKNQKKYELTELPYEKEKYLFSPAERSFLGILDDIVGEDYRIFGKVRLLDVIAVENGLSDSKRQSAFNRIKSKHLDFVICTRDDFSIVGVIELDDKSHNHPTRKKRDVFLNQALKAAEVPILHYPVKMHYSKDHLRERLVETLGLRFEQSPQRQELIKIPIEDDREETSRISEFVAANYGQCPSCNGQLEKRKISKGTHSGKFILSCNNYPKCRYVSPYKGNGEIDPQSNEPVFAIEDYDLLEAELSDERFKL